MKEAGARSVVAASTGNHGIAVATAAATIGLPSTIVVPKSVSEVKTRAIERAGSRLIFVDSSDALDAETRARQISSAATPYISPYNDSNVVAGQGTIAPEVLEDSAALGIEIDAVCVAVGGGGLISGIGTWFQTA